MKLVSFPDLYYPLSTRYVQRLGPVRKVCGVRKWCVLYIFKTYIHGAHARAIHGNTRETEFPIYFRAKMEEFSSKLGAINGCDFDMSFKEMAAMAYTLFRGKYLRTKLKLFKSLRRKKII